MAAIFHTDVGKVLRCLDVDDYRDKYKPLIANALGITENELDLRYASARCISANPQYEIDGEQISKVFPSLDDATLHGVACEIVGAVCEINKEIDPAAVLATTLTLSGAAFGNRLWVDVSHTKHPPRLYTVLVGRSSFARKGTSFEPVKVLHQGAENILQQKLMFQGNWQNLCIHPGPMSSGEGLIEKVRDPSREVDENGRPVTEGVLDKRLLITEQELGGALSMKYRTGNTLSTVLRSLWDTGSQGPLTRKKNAIQTTDAHLCIVGHITTPELFGLLDKVEIHNGFGNRFLWICVERKGIDAEPRTLSQDIQKELSTKLAHAIPKAHELSGPISRSNTASEYWRELYTKDLGIEKPNKSVEFTAMTARAAAQTARLSLIYALLDGSNRIEHEHVHAAYKFWKYAEQSVDYLWGGIDPLLKKVHKVRVALLQRRKMSRTEISEVLGRNSSALEVDEIRERLCKQGEITWSIDSGNAKGRPSETWVVRQ